MNLASTHPRDLRRRIWVGLLSATDQEIRDGMDFYPGAHGLCRLISTVSSSMFQPSLSPHQIAGIYAALSPMNGWDTNVSNILDILRYGSFAQVNTPEPNRQKALKILQGADPLTILRGSKVRAFYRAIADPSDLTPIPVDRHLISLALGTKLTSAQLSRITSSSLYSSILTAYTDLGNREGIGNRLASIAWFVQRRNLTHQSLIPHPDSPVCCQVPMYFHGKSRFRCPICLATRTRFPQPRFLRPVSRSAFTTNIDLPTSAVFTRNHRNRILIHLGIGHPFTNSAGWQYLSRYVVMATTNEILHSDEHVHHTNGILTDCTTSNLEVWLAERHGRHHARHQLLYMLRDRLTGRFLPSPVPSYADQVRAPEGFDPADPYPDLASPGIGPYSGAGGDSGPVYEGPESPEVSF